MDRTELTLMAAAALLVAIAIGWGLRWIYDLLNPPPPPEPVADSEWAEYAKACETAREAAVNHLGEVERDMGNRLTQMQAELDAAMEGLGDARRQADYYESELQTLRAGVAVGGAAVVAEQVVTQESSEPDFDVMAPVAEEPDEVEQVVEEVPHDLAPEVVEPEPEPEPAEEPSQEVEDAHEPAEEDSAVEETTVQEPVAEEPAPEDAVTEPEVPSDAAEDVEQPAEDATPEQPDVVEEPVAAKPKSTRKPSPRKRSRRKSGRK